MAKKEVGHFEARDFDHSRGAKKSGVMQRIMSVFVTKDRDKRSASNG
jgi:hypothetical protein